jgi:hypothetical protein
MISSFNWFVATLLLIIFDTSTDSSFKIVIATLVLWFGSIGSSYINRSRRYSEKLGGVRTIALVSFIAICLIIPQVEIDLTKFSIRPTERINMGDNLS